MGDLWRAANLLQFLPMFVFLETGHARENGYHHIVCTESDLFSASQAFGPKWTQALNEEADPTLKPMLAKLAQADLPVPIFGFELCDSKNVVQAEAEMAWPDQRVAVLFPNVFQDTAAVWRKKHWKRRFPIPRMSLTT